MSRTTTGSSRSFSFLATALLPSLALLILLAARGCRGGSPGREDEQEEEVLVRVGDDYFFLRKAPNGMDAQMELGPCKDVGKPYNFDDDSVTDMLLEAFRERGIKRGRHHNRRPQRFWTDAALMDCSGDVEELPEERPLRCWKFSNGNRPRSEPVAPLLAVNHHEEADCIYYDTKQANRKDTGMGAYRRETCDNTAIDIVCEAILGEWSSWETVSETCMPHTCGEHWGVPETRSCYGGPYCPGDGTRYDPATCLSAPPSDCSNQTDGVTGIQIVDGEVPVCVECVDGWTLIQSRDASYANDEQYFNRKWDEYVDGFGVTGEERWIGLENIHQMTKDGDYSVKFVLWDDDGNIGTALYDQMTVGDAASKYTLTSVGSFVSGSVRNLFYYNEGAPFSTIDQDNKGSRCVELRQGGWWYHYCSYVCLNNPYIRDVDLEESIQWRGFNQDNALPKAYFGLKRTLLV